jgi:hypothetical protein
VGLGRLEVLAMGQVSLCSRSRSPLYNQMSLSWAVLIRQAAPCIQAAVRFVVKESYTVLVLDDIPLVCFPMGTPNHVDYKKKLASITNNTILNVPFRNQEVGESIEIVLKRLRVVRMKRFLCSVG